MDENINLLIEKFKDIANKEWIKSISKSHGSIGLTFEKELKKKPDNKYLPDYGDIEIKCTSNYNLYPITLFSITFDGPSINEINRIVEKYGYYDKIYQKKIIFANINNKRPSVVNKKYIFKFDIDYKTEKIYLCIYDIYNTLIERESYIDINNLYNHINTKMKKIAIIYGKKKIKDNNTYFKYYKMQIYKFTSIEKFLLALENGIINVQLIINIYRSGNRKGKVRNKNLTFQIDKNKINIIFDEIC